MNAAALAPVDVLATNSKRGPQHHLARALKPGEMRTKTLCGKSVKISWVTAPDISPLETSVCAKCRDKNEAPTREPEATDSYARDLDDAGLAPDPEPVTSDDAPGLMDAHGSGVKELRAWLDGLAKDEGLMYALTDGPNVSVMWGKARLSLADAANGSAPLPDLVDANGRIRVRRGGARKDTILRVSELRDWILSEDAREEKRKAQQVDLEGKPLVQGGAKFWSEPRVAIFARGDLYKVSFTKGTLDSFRGMDSDNERLLWLDDHMRLIPEARKTLTEPVDETQRAMERLTLLKLALHDEPEPLDESELTDDDGGSE